MGKGDRQGKNSCEARQGRDSEEKGGRAASSRMKIEVKRVIENITAVRRFRSRSKNG